MNFLDTHFHLDLWQSPEELFQKIETQKIYTIAVTNTPSVFNYTNKLTQNSKYVRAALGLHPELVFERYGELPEFMNLIHLTRYIGEIGLDYTSNNNSNHKLQRNIFETIIEKCANSSNKVLTVHSRRAEKDVINIIGNTFPGKAILHWYSGSIKELNKALEYGFYFSINSAMVKSKTGRRLITQIPLDRILTESDGPFVKNHLNTPFSPINIKETVFELTNLFDLKHQDIMRDTIYSNFRNVIQ